jgi:transketolase
MKFIVPCDYIEAKKATASLASDVGPAYLRLGREKVATITDENTKFDIGKANVMRNGRDVVVFACGVMVQEALKAADILEHEHISLRVVNLHTIKPIDVETIVESAKQTGAVVTAEEHQIMAGMGSSVCEVLAQHYPVPVEMIGMKDAFGESGEPFELLKTYGLTDVEIVAAVKRVLKRK